MTEPEPAVLVFDVNETLIDIESLAPHFERIFGDTRVLREWFGQLVMYSMALTLSGQYADFGTLGRAVMRMTAEVHRVNVTDGDLRDFAAGMRTMPAHPDVAGGLAALRNLGYRMVTLTNSPASPDGRTPLQNAGLGEYFERQFSVDPQRAFKPAPQLYTGVTDELGVPTSAAMMVAAHPWDLLGAQAVGMSTALLTRPGNAALSLPGIAQPTLVATDVGDLARALSEGRT
ncbi:MAG: haloacid dehalogenase type II [Mycobacterium sp.]|nr:haloacid dehalogenase type II [Mycobacterium sp.]